MNAPRYPNAPPLRAPVIMPPGSPAPVSRWPADAPPFGALNGTGEIYGTQSSHTWAAGQTDTREICDVTKAPALWRLSVFGNVLVSIGYGTNGNRQILNLQAPCVITLPGQFTARATPRDNAGTSCVVTLTQATAGALSQARKLADAAGGAVALDEGACRYVALTASTLTISGVAVAVPALAVVPLVSGAVLNTGSGFQEFEA